uniref:Uncharacterized protein n=1 Tax=Tetranychus urticae TaxID=32264 RepID=T1KVH1_TETUR
MPSNNKVITSDLEKLIGERDYLKREVNRLENEVSSLIKTKHESDQLCYLLLSEKENLISAYTDLETLYKSSQSELMSLKNVLIHQQTSHQKTLFVR